MGSVTLGKKGDGTPYRLSGKDRRTHLHVCGASGRGKSRFLEGMIRDDILSGRGVCLIDPHGTLYERIIRWIAMHNIHRDRKVHLIDPALAGWTTGINPLRLRAQQGVSARVDAVIEAMSEVWGGEEMARTPLLKKCLRAVLRILIVNRLTLLEAMELITAADSNNTRKFLTDNVHDYVHRHLWADFNSLNQRTYSEQFMSTINRFVEFLDSPEVRPIIGTDMQPIDLRACMDNSDIVLVNLKKGALSHDNARLIGTLITNDLFSHALDRDERLGEARPFYLYVDECSRFLTRTIEYTLDECRKFGLHCILSHQRLGQLRRENETLFNGIMGGAQTKVIFGCEEDDDAEILSRHLFRSEFNLDRPVANLMKPTPVDQVRESFASESDTHSRVEGAGESTVTNFGTVTGHAQHFDADGMPTGGFVESVGISEGGATAETRFSAVGEAHSIGRHEGLRTVYENLPTQNWTLERWIHEGMVRLRGLPARHAIVKAPGQGSVQIKPHMIRDPISSVAMTAQAVQRILSNSAYAVPRVAVDDELKDRHVNLREAIARWENSGSDTQTYDDDAF